MSNYIERKKKLAALLDADQEDCRANDMTNAYGYNIGGQREICVIADNVEDAAEAIRAKMEELGL